MELRHLRYFCAVADTGGFARASEVLHVAQSAISEQLKDLEEELNVALFDRREHRARLTPHGDIFLKEARRTLEVAAQAVEAARRSGRGETGTLTIGFFVGGTDALFPALIRTFRTRSPGVQVTLVEMTPTAQHEALLSGAIDIAFTRAALAPSTELIRMETFYVDPLVAVLPPDHVLGGRPVRMKQLAKERFVIAQRDTSPAYFDRVISLCRDAGFSPNIAAMASVASGVLTLVAAGEGIAILPRNTLKLASGEVAVSSIRSRDATIEVVIAWNARREGPLHRAFLDQARRARRSRGSHSV
jgi:DNA-binding transcriptional LysR family regulator